jgi:hypothetical protein
MCTEINIDYYLNKKNFLQDKINSLEQDKLIKLFDIILESNPDIQYSRNKNGYFIDIKILPLEVIEKLQKKCLEFENNLIESL